MTLRWILEKYVVSMWIGFIWLRTGPSGCVCYLSHASSIHPILDFITL